LVFGPAQEDAPGWNGSPLGDASVVEKPMRGGPWKHGAKARGENTPEGQMSREDRAAVTG
jgi:hypothetical protein